jgi:RNA polymerase sigma-70 factor (ECF subfamily)
MAPRVENASTGEEARTPDSAGVLLIAARGGCSRSLGTLAQRYRRYLLHVARESLSPALRAKVGASDLVQDTLLHFQQRFDRFAGSSEEELLTWLRRILYFRALHVARRYGGTAARDVRRELSVYESRSSLRQGQLVDPAPTPCTEMLAREQLDVLNTAIAELPEDARLVIRLRNVERLSFFEVGTRLGCSQDAARKRWVRAVAALRAKLTSHERNSEALERATP